MKRPESRGKREASPAALRRGGLLFLLAGLPTAIWVELKMGAVEMVAGVLLLAVAHYAAGPRPYSRWTKKTWKKYLASGRFRDCCFADDGCWIHDNLSDHRFNYDALIALWEDGERFYLVVPGNQVYILRKEAFTKGTPAELAAFWEARTGRRVGQVR